MLINNIPPGLALIAPAVPVSPSDNDDAIPCISTDAAANKYVPYSAIPTAAPPPAKMGQQRQQPRAPVKSQSKPITAIPRGHSDMARRHLQTHL